MTMTQIKTLIASLCLCTLGNSVTAATIAGELDFQNGTSNFFSGVNPVTDDTFSIEFNPFDLLFLVNSQGVFSPFFGSPPVEGVPSSIGEFKFSSGDASSFTYNFTNDLVFDFDAGGSVVIESGASFLGSFTSSDTVEFVMDPSASVLATGVVDPLTITDATFQFSDTASPAGGGYNVALEAGDGVAPVPLPAPAFLLLAGLGGLAVAARRRA